MRNRNWLFLAAGGLLACAMASNAATITPSTYSATIGIGDSITIHKTITVDASGTTRLDVYFLADNTGSMGSIIGNAQSGAAAIMNDPFFAGKDVSFGVGRYVGDPSEPGMNGSSSYQVLQTITSSNANVQNAINMWYASGGGDIPEGNLYALQQAASGGLPGINGVSSGEAVGWRSGAQPIIAWFGDAAGHQATVNLSESIDALTGAGIAVVGFNSLAAGYGIDGSYDDTAGNDLRNQASAIAAATGGSVTDNFTSLSGSAFVSAIVDAISSAAATVNLTFGTSGDTSGLGIAFTCTDALGCNNVPAGDSRTFDLTITGVTAGTYAFSSFANGVDAAERDLITVTGRAGVAEPNPTWLMLLGGGLMLGLAGLRRRYGAGR